MKMQDLNKNEQLLSTHDREDLVSSIQNLKYSPPKIDNALTGCISIKDQVLRQLQMKRDPSPVAQQGVTCTDLNPFNGKMDLQTIDQYMKSDKNYESIYKQMVKEIKIQLLEVL